MDAELREIRRIVRTLHEQRGLPWVRIAELVHQELNEAIWDHRLDEGCGPTKTVVYGNAADRSPSGYSPK